jgi:hypothetical protein
MHLNAFSSEKGSVSFTRISEGSLTQTRLRTLEINKGNDPQVDHLKSTVNCTVCNGKKVHFGLCFL